MRLTVDLKAMEMEPKLVDTNMYLLDAECYDSCDRIEILCPWLDSESEVSVICG